MSSQSVNTEGTYSIASREYLRNIQGRVYFLATHTIPVGPSDCPIMTDGTNLGFVPPSNLFQSTIVGPVQSFTRGDPTFPDKAGGTIQIQASVQPILAAASVQMIMSVNGNPGGVFQMVVAYGAVAIPFIFKYYHTFPFGPNDVIRFHFQNDGAIPIDIETLVVAFTT